VMDRALWGKFQFTTTLEEKLK